MKTYLVCDLTDKTFYVGSTTTENRPFDHIKGPSHENWKIRKAKKRKHAFFVFVSEDDGFEDRREEQFYLDFYYGTEWSLNLSSRAVGNPQGLKKALLRSLEEGTHNFLKENRNSKTEAKRLKNLRESVGGEKNPAKRPEVRERCSEKAKGRRFWKNKITGEIKSVIEAPSKDWVLADRSWWVNSKGERRHGPPPDPENWQRGMKWKNS